MADDNQNKRVGFETNCSSSDEDDQWWFPIIFYMFYMFCLHFNANENCYQCSEEDERNNIKINWTNVYIITRYF